jgi:F0F1-type ATP synthase assembly protein I
MNFPGDSDDDFSEEEMNLKTNYRDDKRTQSRKRKREDEKKKVGDESKDMYGADFSPTSIKGIVKVIPLLLQLIGVIIIFY